MRIPPRACAHRDEHDATKIQLSPLRKGEARSSARLFSHPTAHLAIHEH